ncbi:putative coiled-coil domain-containing protein 30 [Scophthalmus maximus]|uniref:Putative coiled-coil domain-containing protein 30 n=1 Tax=Scophthalmus maximus TaxID=52904 RepID=A0A2U9C370_SCOMX|nr:putative coiled-coil domain-containing protein 30 [Scophthalmus maximus]
MSLRGQKGMRVAAAAVLREPSHAPPRQTFWEDRRFSWKLEAFKSPHELQTELDQISMRLQEDGLPPAASAEERQRYLWQQLLREEARRHSVTQEMQTIRTQQASEMKEVESYVAHIRGLLEERECLTADYERDNEHLRRELLQIRQQQESQTKELAEMLAQEDLGEMGLSSPSEQVAYLLVERATLLERLEAAERRLESQSLTGNSMEGHHQGQEHIHHMMGEELRQRREDMQKSMDNMTKARSEEISQEQNERQRLERDLEEASRRLAMAHQDIRRLTSELDVAKNNNLDSSDMMKLQQAKEQNDRLDAENRALRERVRTIESEKQNLRGQCQNSVLSQKAEEAKQMRQDLQRAQSLFTSAERELRYEKERNMDLKRHNTLLDQEKLKLCAELKQVQTKLVQAEQTVHSQAAEGERQQQKTRELELELARSSTNRSAATSLQEDLQAERVQLITADKKVLELQQQLKNAQHQLRVEEARAGETSRLERDSRDLSDTLSALRAQQHEEHITRKLLEQREEELQQQVRSLRLKEASLTRTNTELSHRAQQLETRLTILEAELSKAREEVREGQRSSHRLQEELAASQQECDRLPGELQQVLLQLDTHVRKYNEKHSQHKTKLRQAKQVFLKAMAQRDRTIQKLENDLVLASSLLHKEKERIDTVLEENEKLLEERRELLRKISEAEEMGSNGMRTASTVQHRVNVLEVENRQLQDRTLKLSNQVSSLERALRNTQSFYSLENAKKVLPSESLCDSILHASTLSLTSGSCDPLEILDKLCRVKVGERAVEEGVRASVSAHQLSEQGYLNLTSPLVSPEAKATEESSNNSDMV